MSWLAPRIVKRSVLPEYGCPLLSVAVTVKVIGTPCGAPAFVGLTWRALGTALRITSE